MIATVTRVDSAGVYVSAPSMLPGVELGPLPALVHRYHDDPPATGDRFTEYEAGDRVLVLEDRLNEFIVHGIVQGG